MRTIKFRGKDTATGRWVYGDLVHNMGVTEQGLKPRVMVGGYEVEEHSVGQFTGITDKHGKEIYEGDVVVVEERDYSDDDKWLITYDEFEVLWHPGYLQFRLQDTEGYYKDFDKTYERYQIVGNFYDRKKED